MSARLKIKRGSTTSWADSANKDTTLEPGQLGVEYLTDGNMRLKVGKQTDNGSATDWSLLPYVTPLTSVYQDDHIELYSGYKTLSVNTEGYVTNPGTYGTIHLGDPSSPYHNIRLNGDSEVVLAAPTTIVQGALSVIPATGVELKVSPGSYSDSPKLSSVGSGNNSYLQIANLIADDAAGGTNRGIEFVSSFKTNVVSTCSLRWDYSGTPKLYSTSSGCLLGDPSNPWFYVYSSGLGLGSLTGTGTTSGGSSNRDLSVNASDSVTFGNGKYGTVNNRISLLTSKVVKSSASDSATTYNGKLYVYSDGTDSGDLVVLELQDSGKSSSSANSTNSLVLKSVGDSKSSTSYNGNGMIQFQCTNYSGSSSFTNTVTIGGHADIIQMYPSTAVSYLGTFSAQWGNLYATSTYTDRIIHTGSAGPSHNIEVGNNLIPNDNSTSASEGYTLGNSNYKWRYLYAFSGTIQTSDRSAKDSIHYIQYVEDSEAMKPATMSMRSTAVENTSDGTTSQITLEDVIDFVNNLNPVTFCYKDGQGEDVEATEENSDPEDIQLGLIADDIKDHKLFKYVGVETTYEEEITPAVKDEEGNVVTEAVTETKTTLGLQAIPLATAALTACKYLIQKNEEIESRLSAIEDQLIALLNTEVN